MLDDIRVGPQVEGEPHRLPVAGLEQWLDVRGEADPRARAGQHQWLLGRFCLLIQHGDP